MGALGIVQALLRGLRGSRWRVLDVLWSKPAAVGSCGGESKPLRSAVTIAGSVSGVPIGARPIESFTPKRVTVAWDLRIAGDLATLMQHGERSSPQSGEAEPKLRDRPAMR